MLVGVIALLGLAASGVLALPPGGPPSLWALLPAVLAIVLALVTHQVVISLVGGIVVGLMQLSGDWHAFPKGLDLLVTVLTDADKMKVILFTLLIGGMVGVVQAGGGSKGIVEFVRRFARTRRSGAMSTWVLGMLVFFDDYASTLLVGTTMRPVTDALRISREKLSYIVDSTAAPIASVALVSSWIGYEVSTMGEAMKAAGIEAVPYQVFLDGIPARFYPILALYFVGLVALSRKDFGPMLQAEKRAYVSGQVLREGASPLVDDAVAREMEEQHDAPPRAQVAVVSVGVLVGTVLLVLFAKGQDASYDALLYGAGAAGLCSVLYTTALSALSVTAAIEAFVGGIRAMTMAVLVLVLAWCIGKVMGDLRAGAAVADLVGTALPGWSLPTVTFFLAALMALSTGTSWGTMAILFPIIIPVLAAHQADPAFANMLIGTTSAVLAGAVFGDHCSPISDTTVLSSIAAASDHMDHTRTQMPYALFVGAFSVLFGTLPVGLGLHPGACLVLAGGGLTAVFWFIGRRSDEGGAGTAQVTPAASGSRTDRESA